MKTSILVRLHHRTDAEGRRTLLLQVTRERRHSTCNLPYRLLPEEFDKLRGRAVPRNRTRVHRAFICEVNRQIEESLQELNAIVGTLDASGQPYTAQDVTAACRRNGDLQYIETFAVKLIAELEARERFGAARSYRSLLSVFKKFSGAGRLRFRQVDSRTVAAFAEYLERRGNRRNTVTFYLRTFRALYNRARLRGFAPDINPFCDVSFKPGGTSTVCGSYCRR